MHLSQEQRTRVACLIRGVAFEDLSGPENLTLVHHGNGWVAAWNDSDTPVVGLSVVLVDGLPFVACCDASDRLRANIAEALGTAPVRLDEIARADDRRPSRSQGLG